MFFCMYVFKSKSARLACLSVKCMNTCIYIFYLHVYNKFFFVLVNILKTHAIICLSQIYNSVWIAFLARFDFAFVVFMFYLKVVNVSVFFLKNIFYSIRRYENIWLRFQDLNTIHKKSRLVENMVSTGMVKVSLVLGADTIEI